MPGCYNYAMIYLFGGFRGMRIDTELLNRRESPYRENETEGWLAYALEKWLEARLG